MKSIQGDCLTSHPGVLSGSDYARQRSLGFESEWVDQPSSKAGEVVVRLQFEKIISNICGLPWQNLGSGDILKVALAYYYFSVQFRENLEIACRLFPDDQALGILHAEECNTSNLSPWEDVARDGEAMNHDEFMRRLLLLQPIAEAEGLKRAGAQYLARIRKIDDRTRARSIASYEDGGLARVFSAMLRAPAWEGRGQLAFKHFLQRHIEFDSPEEGGHGALSRHLSADDSISPLWAAFEDLLRFAVPAFSRANVSGR